LLLLLDATKSTIFSHDFFLMTCEDHKIDARDLRLKLQRKSFQQASPRSGVRDLREKLSGTMNSQPANVDPPKPKIAVAKPARRSVAVEAPEPEIKKTANVVSRKGYQQKA